MDFTVCVLLFGDYPQLAHRCLNDELLSLIKDCDCQLRIGLNTVSEQVEEIATGLVDRGYLKPEHLFNSSVNLHKYPMMRRMVHEAPNPVSTPYLLWFDDDSYIKPGTDPKGWLRSARNWLEHASMIGSIYVMALQGNQEKWIKTQPWYNGKPFLERGSRHQKYVKFATGGFWGIRTQVLRDFNWPIPELDHRGGDTMLGEVLRQNDLLIKQFNINVAINANSEGRESRAPRRGFDSKPIGWNHTG